MVNQTKSVDLSGVTLNISYFGTENDGPRGQLQVSLSGDPGPGVEIVAFWKGNRETVLSRTRITQTGTVYVPLDAYITQIVAEEPLTVRARHVDNHDDLSNPVTVKYNPQRLPVPEITGASSFLQRVSLKGVTTMPGTLISATVGGKTAETRINSASGPMDWTLTVPDVPPGTQTASVIIKDPTGFIFSDSAPATINVDVSDEITPPLTVDFPKQTDITGLTFSVRGTAKPGTGPIHVSAVNGTEMETPLDSTGYWNANIAMIQAGETTLTVRNLMTGEVISYPLTISSSSFSFDRCVMGRDYGDPDEKLGYYLSGRGDPAVRIFMRDNTGTWQSITTVPSSRQWEYSGVPTFYQGKLTLKQEHRPDNEQQSVEGRIRIARHPELRDPVQGKEITLPYTLRGETFWYSDDATEVNVILSNHLGVIATIPVDQRDWEYTIEDLPEGDNKIWLSVSTNSSYFTGYELGEYILKVKKG
ncbi:hypothetical protein [Enterobacter sp. 22466]|uniref:hypothetical protein n=1 Tax=Enterobacter sp. 22466 TaxID=3453924 RepID=UPI003F84E587